jgi:hypothetical protein
VARKKASKGVVIVSPSHTLMRDKFDKKGKWVGTSHGFHKREKQRARVWVEHAKRRAREGSLEHELDEKGNVVVSYRPPGLGRFPEVLPTSERLAVVKKLVSHGYDVRFIHAENISAPEFYSRAEELGAKPVKSPDVNPQWIRNWADQFIGPKGSKILVNNAFNAKTLKGFVDKKDLVKTKGVLFGEVVKGHDFVLASENAAEKVREHLEEIGLEVFTMPPGKLEVPVEGRLGRKVVKEKVFEKYNDIDVFINAIPSKKLFVVDPRYYSENKKLIKKIAEKKKYKIVKIALSEAHLMPANFIDLPDGRILINKAKRLAAQLEKHGLKKDRDFIMMDRPVKSQQKYLGGGLRCFSLSLIPKKKALEISERLKREVTT